MRGDGHLPVATPGPWTDEAACKGATAKMVDELAVEAVKVCAVCPVLAECRSWALTTPDPAKYLVAGGYTTSQRARVRRGRPQGGLRPSKPPTKPAPPPVGELPPDTRTRTMTIPPLPLPPAPAGPDDIDYSLACAQLALRYQRLHPAIAAVLADDELRSMERRAG